MLHFPESSENGNMVLLHELGLSAEGDGSSDLPACIQKRNGHTGQPQVGLLIVQRIALLADALCLLQKDIGISDGLFRKTDQRLCAQKLLEKLLAAIGQQAFTCGTGVDGQGGSHTGIHIDYGAPRYLAGDESGEMI